jgi:hypothetical protein
LHVYGSGIAEIKVQSSDDDARFHAHAVDGQPALLTLTSGTDDSTDSFTIATGPSAKDLRFIPAQDPGDAPSMVILQTGNVGIGTTAPGTKFIVNGGAAEFSALFTRTGNGDHNIMLNCDNVLNNTNQILFNANTNGYNGGYGESSATTFAGIETKLTQVDPQKGQMGFYVNTGDAHATALTIQDTGNVTFYYDIIASVSGSTTSTGSFGQVELTSGWQAGSQGNAEYIALTPGDFNTHDNTTTREYGPVVQNEGSHISMNSTSYNAYAMKIVPKGFTAVTAVVYGASAGASAAVWNAYSSSISLGSNSTTLTGNTALGTTDTFSTSITGDGATYCILEFNPGDTTDDVYGGKITLKKST